MFRREMIECYMLNKSLEYGNSVEDLKVALPTMILCYKPDTFFEQGMYYTVRADRVKLEEVVTKKDWEHIMRTSSEEVKNKLKKEFEFCNLECEVY